MNFEKIKEIITEIYEEVITNKSGEVADYIPQLSQVNPDLFGISVCTIDGYKFDIGDTKEEFCLQSCSKPLSYCIARELNGLDGVHKHVGYEPSGGKFNAFILNKDGKPHNPLINAGSIMVCSLIEPDEEPSHKFDIIHKYYKRASANSHIGFDTAVFLSEKHHADRNISLAYYMRENGAFNDKMVPSKINETLELYFQACSITINTDTGAILSSTLANNGICPISQERIFETDVVRDCLSLMYMCGMYDYSGQFAFEIGLPAKSGVSGCIMLIVPNVMGVCIWSPRLDDNGNSVRGVEVCKKLNEKTNYIYHIFNNITNKLNQTKKENEQILPHILITASSKGDLNKIKQLHGKVDFNEGDYDNRTPLHLAATEGHLDVVQYFLENGVEADVKDRWGNTPYHEAHKQCNESDESEVYVQICDVIEKYIQAT